MTQKLCSKDGLAAFVLSALLCFSGSVFGQAIVRPVSITNLTTDNELGIFNDAAVGNRPHATNYIWADDPSDWISNGFPSTLYGLPLVHTLAADSETEGDTTVVEFDVSQYSQVVVWHADAQITKPDWLTADFTHCSTGLEFFLGTAPASGYCRYVAAGTAEFGGNCPTGGCDTAIPMYVVGVVNAARPLQTTEVAASDPGVVRFTTSSVTCDESTTCSIHLERVDGSSGAAEANIAEAVNPSFGVLNHASRTWADGVGGIATATVDLAGVTGNQIMTVEITSATGATAGEPSTITINITDLTTTPTAEDYYVNNSGTPACSNANAGTAAGSPWCSIGRANSVQAAGGGPTRIHVKTGSYRNDPWIPAFSGDGAGEEIEICAQDGDVTLLGPATGNIDNAILINPGISFVSAVECEAGNRITIDGEVVFGTGAGQVEKGESSEGFGHIDQGAEIYGDNVTLDIDHTRTVGWVGVYVDQQAGSPTLRPNTNLHGTPYYPFGGGDFGDTFWIDQNMAGTNPVLFDGGTAGRSLARGGHAALLSYGGRMIVRGIAFDGSWGAVPTFSNTFPDGNRGMMISRRANNSHVHDVVFNRSGRPQDQNWVECYKAEGTRTVISNAWVRNCMGWAMIQTVGDFTIHVRHIRHAHVVFENIGGPIGFIQQYPDPWGGESLLNDIQYKNIIVKDFGQNTDIGCCAGSPWTNVLFYLDLVGAQTIDNVGFRVDGMTIENDTGSCNDVQIWVNGGADSGGWTIPTLEAEYPNVMNNVTCTTDAGLDNLPGTGVNSTVPQMAAYLALDPADTLSRGQGVWLTTASNSGTNSTNLCVADVTYFSRPASVGTPGVGQWSSGYDVRIQGGVSNTVQTAATPTDDTGTDGCITLATPRTWTAGVGVGYGMSGAAPNRGYVR